MTKLPPPPPEVGDVAPNRDMLRLAPLFAEKVFTLLDELQKQGYDPVVREGFRSDARQSFLYGFGRCYDDGRGIVTKAATAAKSWHRYGLAVDIVSAAHGDNAPSAFWRALRIAAAQLFLVSGDDWDRDGIPVEDDPDEHLADKPHIQWWIPAMRVTPSDHAWEVLQTQGVEAVWRELRAVYVPTGASV